MNIKYSHIKELLFSFIILCTSAAAQADQIPKDLNIFLKEINDESDIDSNRVIVFDSLLSHFQEQKDTISQFYVLNEKALYYLKINEAPKAIEILEKLIADSLNIKHDKLQSEIYFNLGFAYMENLQYFASFPYFNKAYKLSKTTNDTLLRARSLHFKGVESFLNGDNIGAAKEMYEAYLILEKFKDYEYLLHSTNDMGVFFMNLKNGEKAHRFLKLALKYDSLNPATIRSYEPIIYTNLGVLYLNVLSNFDSSVYYNTKALEKMHKNSNWLDRFPAINNMQVIHLKTGNIEAAYQYFKNAYEDEKLKKIPYHYSGVLLNYSSTLIQMKEYELAYKISEDALKLSRENNRKPFELSALINLYKIDSIRGDYKKALGTIQEVIKAEKNLNAQEIELELIRLQIDTEIDKLEKNYKELLFQNQVKQSTIDHLNKLNYSQWVLIILFLGISVVLIISFIRNKRLLKNLHSLNIEQGKSNNLLQAQAQKIEEENKNKDRIISLLSHDFRSPLSNLTALINALFDTWNEMDDSDKIIHLKKLNIQTINTLNNVEETLSWAQLNRNKIKAHYASVLIADIFEKIKFDTEISANNKNIELLFENNINTSIQTDPEILGHIINNLLNNAIKFTPKNGNIYVQSKIENNECLIIVTDSGIGIPKDKLDDLFTLKHQFNRKGTEGENTTGLGLVIIKKLCIMIGARIESTSTVGLGSTFTVICPIKNQ